MKKRVTSILMVFVMIVTLGFGMYSVPASAAAAASVYAVENGPGIQSFDIVNIGDATGTFTWDAGEYGTGSVDLAPGETYPLDFQTYNSVMLMVTDSIGNAYPAYSLNRYMVEVCAVYGSDVVQLATHSLRMSEGTFSYSVDSQVNYNGKVYQCVSPTTQYLNYYDGNTYLEFVYEEVVQEPYTVNISFVDTNGYSVGSDSFSVNPGEIVEYSAPAQISANGTTYDLVSTAMISHNYTSTKRSYVFQYEAQAAVSSKPYSVKFTYVDKASGSIIGTHSETITSNQTLVFEVPQTLTVGTSSYRLSSGEAGEITHEFSNSNRNYTVYYDKTAENQPYNVVINLVDASGKVLDSLRESVSYGMTLAYDLESEITVDGISYILAGGQGSRIMHSYGDHTRTYNVYYNAEGSADASAYAINVRYVDVKTNEVLHSENKNVDPGADIEFSVPSEYSSGDNEYVILSGQGESITHPYNSARRTYIVYYRDINDESNSSTSVEEQIVTEIITEEGETIYEPNVITIITNEEEGTVATVDEEGATVTIPDEQTPLAETPEEDAQEDEGTVTLEDESTPLGEQPEETDAESTTTLEDETTPLAQLPTDGDSSNGSSVNMPLIIGGIAVVAVIIIAGAAFIIIKKKGSAK